MKKELVVLTALMLTAGFAAAQDATLNGGDVTQSDVSTSTGTSNWAMVYGTVTENVNLSDGTTDVFTWSDQAPDGSAVLADETDNAWSGDASNLNAVTGQSDVSGTDTDGVPTTGTDSYNNTFTNSTELTSVISGTNTNSTVSDTFGGSGDNLYVYADSNSDPVWAGEVQAGQMVNGQDYETMVGSSVDLSSEGYDLYVEISN